MNNMWDRLAVCQYMAFNGSTHNQPDDDTAYVVCHGYDQSIFNIKVDLTSLMSPFTQDEGADMVWLPLKYFEKSPTICQI